MKKLLTLVFLLPLLTNAQFSINAGLNYSHFSGQGNYGHASPGFAGGVSDRIALSGNWFLQPSLSYERKGAHNSSEGWNFNVYSVVLDGFVGYKLGNVALMAAPYYERVLYASNSRFDGDGFGWSGKDWTFWNRNQFGLTTAIEWDMIGASLHLEYSHGISQVRGELKDWTGLPSYVLWKNRNEVLGLRLSVPFKTFGL